jgi:hypothetical protein
LNIARTVPRHSRGLFTNNSRSINYRRLAKLEQEANASPTDALKQATLYKASFFLSIYIFINMV